MRKQHITVVILIAVLVLSVLSLLPHHDCDGDHCAVCAAADAAKSALPVAAAFFAVLSFSLIRSGKAFEDRTQAPVTPVSMHVLNLN